MGISMDVWREGEEKGVLPYFTICLIPLTEVPGDEDHEMRATSVSVLSSWRIREVQAYKRD